MRLTVSNGWVSDKADFENALRLQISMERATQVDFIPTAGLVHDGGIPPPNPFAW
jgi:hypothetical protein